MANGKEEKGNGRSEPIRLATEGFYQDRVAAPFPILADLARQKFFMGFVRLSVLGNL
jgi:hypothetical protein